MGKKTKRMDVLRFYHPSESSPKVESWLAAADPSLRSVDLVVTSAGSVDTHGPSTVLAAPIVEYGRPVASADVSEKSFGSSQPQPGMRMLRAAAGRPLSEVIQSPSSELASGASAEAVVRSRDLGRDPMSLPASSPAGTLLSVRFACNVCGLDGWLRVDGRDTAVKYCPVCGMIQRWS